MTQMRAVVIHAPGGPEALKIEQRTIPAPRDGWVLIRVRAFGLNRAEMFTRQGHSPNAVFPRILGIEAVGTVATSNGTFVIGEKVTTVMGGMGRAFDGGYAEYTLVPEANVMRQISRPPLT
jgi:NADPH:quinone reductase-like Zn-dependent oxidoreductase